MKTVDKTQLIQARRAPVGSDRDTVWELPVRATRHDRRAEAGIAGVPHRHGALHRATVEARAALQDAALSAAGAAARARSLAEALDEALAILASVPLAESTLLRGNGSVPAADLSPREREVLALVADGRSNKAIAEALFVSPNTVKTHITSLFHKMQVHSRAQLAATAARQELRLQGTE
ncbi:MAG: response regulator transcription factor, partial [Thermomicrobiales bacterium]